MKLYVTFIFRKKDSESKDIFKGTTEEVDYIILLNILSSNIKRQNKLLHFPARSKFGDNASNLKLKGIVTSLLVLMREDTSTGSLMHHTSPSTASMSAAAP